jgi:hypothetical protein
VRSERWLVASLLALTLAHAAAMATLRPMFQASDEVAYVASAQRGALRHAASDAERLAVAPPAGEPAFDAYGKPAFEWTSGWLLFRLAQLMTPAAAAVALRLVFALAALVGVYCAWRTARHLLPDNPLVVWGVPTLVALHPVFITYTAAVTPDAVTNALAAVAVLLLVRVVDGTAGLAGTLGLVAAVAAAIAFKDTALALGVTLALAVPARIWVTWPRRRRGRHTARLARMAGLTLVILALVVAAWPLLRSFHWTYRSDLLERTFDPAFIGAAVRELWIQLPIYFVTFWGHIGNFGGGDLLIPRELIALAAAATLAAGVGLVAAALRRPQWVPPGDTRRLTALAALFGAGVLLTALQAPMREVVLGLQNLFQGRWLFPFLVPLMIALCAGLSVLVPDPRRALPLLVWTAGTVSSVALVWSLVPHYYEQFPATYRESALFLRGTYGVSIEHERLQPFVDRPDWLRSWWWAGTVLVAYFGLLAAWFLATWRLARVPLAARSVAAPRADGDKIAPDPEPAC